MTGDPTPSTGGPGRPFLQAQPDAPEGGPRPRGPRANWVLALLGTIALAMFAGFVALGIWQIERRAWKLDLIERVTARAQGVPQPAPSPDRWSDIARDTDEYRRLQLAGLYAHDQETLVQASTDFGSGFWVMTPLAQADGTTVLVNRGFVTPNKRDPATRRDTAPSGPVQLTGLLRISEPAGGFLRKNDPAAFKWYSRDVAAIGTAHGLARLAPYFVDAEADGRSGVSDPGQMRGELAHVADQRIWPIPGLTVLTFHNSHVVYALTWFGLALMMAAAVAFVARDERRVRERARHAVPRA